MVLRVREGGHICGGRYKYLPALAEKNAVF